MNTTGYGSSLLGTLTVAVLAGVAFCVKNKFKHSECDMDSGCLKIKSHEDSETQIRFDGKFWTSSGGKGSCHLK